jgi:hypothetical protein
MKAIQPVQTWHNGEQVEAVEINITSVYDDLATSAKLYYELLTEGGVKVADGNYDITGEAYEEWGDSGDVNAEAYEMVADALNIILV